MDTRGHFRRHFWRSLPAVDVYSTICVYFTKILTAAHYGVPEQIVFVEALRKTSVGKLDKKVLRERSAGLEGAPEGRSDWDIIFAFVKRPP
jgi:acyl-CoA synthetase (AMP-forming)/AMP-acid ligase II